MATEAINKKGRKKVFFSINPSEEAMFQRRAPSWYFKKMIRPANRYKLILLSLLVFVGVSVIAVASNNFEDEFDGVMGSADFSRGRYAASTTATAATTRVSPKGMATLGETYSNEMEQSMEKIKRDGKVGSEHDHPMLVHTGRLGVTTENDSFDAFDSELSQIVAANDGYFERKSNDSGRSYKSMTASIRIPSQNFDSVVKEIRQMKSIVRIDHYSSETEDVTDEYIDSSARADVLEASRSSLQSLLQKANTVEEILILQNQLNRLTEQSESLRRRALNLKKDSEYSTIVVDVYSAGRFMSDDDSNNDMMTPYHVIILAFGHVYNCIVTIFNIFLYVLVWFVPLASLWFVVTSLCFGKSEAPSPSSSTSFGA